MLAFLLFFGEVKNFLYIHSSNLTISIPLSDLSSELHVQNLLTGE